MTQAVWFSGTKEKGDVEQDIALAHNAFKRLSIILNSKMKSNTSQDYNKASWPFLQADTNGYNRALAEVLKLIQET